MTYRPAPHVVLGTRIDDAPASCRILDVAMGCFWGAERAFWTLPGVYCTAVGYEGGHLANPTYRDVCRGDTGHAETVRIVFDPAQITTTELLQVFFDNHDPTQGLRQGNDVGPQYRSMIFASTEADAATASGARERFAQALAARGFPAVTTEVCGPDPNRTFWLAEDDHQQYLAKNPLGYCGLRGTGVSCALSERDANIPDPSRDR
ncbi:peptide-methionine (S)-S-oxide reductase MsrA [Nanchangia anserum]|uniref:Peptide methionine sulfoxide reductase MsrA n=1 Tax=Nanchangia anserum TaxID=2692125 RepID=A0A8I0GCY1_9ACTO|nr:peptide-methionine (S)-S-oxide reductase MsrA [Nanchangia anserum]MBD3689971.1 peptide-methionine (S)-S-oxide reductase MsrA [Nanchangia anserum]QOX82223.1 peptide-methionine (S)-S-oxide reductase MsrA [Nanchangia anserum]